jgi:hypothetical protein
VVRRLSRPLSVGLRPRLLMVCPFQGHGAPRRKDNGRSYHNVPNNRIGSTWNDSSCKLGNGQIAVPDGNELMRLRAILIVVVFTLALSAAVMALRRDDPSYLAVGFVILFVAGLAFRQIRYIPDIKASANDWANAGLAWWIFAVVIAACLMITVFFPNVWRP